MPARRAPEKPVGDRDGQDDGRFADPLSVERSVQPHPARNGQARPRRGDCPLFADQDQDRRDQGRSPLRLHVFRDAGRRHDGRIPEPRVPSAVAGQADLDHRCVGRPERDHLGGGRGAQPTGIRLCDLGTQRTAAPDPARVRRGASLRSQRAKFGRQFGRTHPEPHRQGRPEIRDFAGPDHPASVRPCRRRAVAVRHHHRHAPEQRTRSGACPLGNAGGRARISRRHSCVAQSRMHHLR